MATSGTVGQFTFDVAMLLEQSVLKAGGTTSMLAGENTQTAIRELNLVLDGMANRGINLWTVERTLVGLNVGQFEYYLPVGTIDVRNVNFRTVTRLTNSSSTPTNTPPGTAFSSAGTAANAFDGNIQTHCDLGGAGNVGYLFTTAVQSTTFGVYPFGSFTADATYAYSSDGVTYTTVYTESAVSFSDLTWYWIDLFSTTPTTAAYWRVSFANVTAGTPSVREFVIGNNQTDIPMGRVNQDDYASYPNKYFPGQPLQYWFNRRRMQPSLVLWPSPNNTFQLMEIFRNRHIEDVTAIRQDVEVPQRWNDYVMWALAMRLIACGIGDFTRVQFVAAMLQQAQDDVENEERDNSPIQWVPGLRGYTR